MLHTGNTYKLYYIGTDHLGSITLLMNEAGNTVERHAYEAWGRERSVTDWNKYAVSSNTILERGYTGHEMLPGFGLINMNGRMYDPVLGRMLSPDNYVQDPLNPQNYNRYGYCLNNPLKYTDPTGEYVIIDDIIAAAVGGVINLVTNAFQGNIHNIGNGLAAFGAGAVGGIGAIYPEFGGWVWGGATVGATNTWLGGATSTEDIIMGAGVGAISGVAGGAAGQWAVSSASPLLSSFSSPVLRGATSGIIGGAVGGYASGFTGGLAMTGDFDAANSAGLNGMWTGAGIGGVAGAGYGYKYALENKISPRTGKSTKISTYQTPQAKGQEGVNRAEQEIVAQGGRVVAREVTLEVNGVRVRVDIAADFNGEIQLIEVKNGPSAGFTPNQKVVYPQMQGEVAVPVIPRGANAARIQQFQVGQPTTEYILKIIKY